MKINEENYNNIHYKIAKIIAESDSIGEGYGYCSNYTLKDFNEDITSKYGLGYASVAKEILDIIKNEN